MALTSVYLNFPGTAEEAFNFYKSIFGGEFPGVMRYKDMPNPEQPIPDFIGEKVMHISLQVGGLHLMAADAIEGFGPPVTYGNNFSIYFGTDNQEDADKFFKALADGGTIGMPIQNTFWGAYFGSLTDKFGINWMVSFDKEN